MWNKGDWVVVIGGTFNKSGKIQDVSFQVASIVEIGLDDLLVKPKDRYAVSLKLVPKKTCRKIPVDNIQVYEELRKPHCGDLVYYYEKNWKKEETMAVSHVWELRNEPGAGVSALITVGNEQAWVSIENLLVLDVNNDTK